MLEGAELEKPFDDGAGLVVADVDDKGTVKVSAQYSKDVGGVKVISSAAVETNIFDIAAKIAAKTSTKWDDQAVELLKRLLGIA